MTPQDTTGTARVASTVEMRRAGVLVGLALWEALLALWVLVCAALTVVVVGLPMLASSLATVRTESARQRRLAWELSGVSAHRDDLPWPDRTAGIGGRVRQLTRLLSDSRTWYDLLWVLVNPVVGGAIALAPIALVINAVFGMLLPLLWGPVVQNWENSWYLFIPLRGTGSLAIAAVLGAVQFVIGFWLAGPCVRLHGRWVRNVLTRVSHRQLQDRVEQLTGSRADIVDLQASELRRIERDLHDGAQARLVAMGMNLSAAERLIDEDPEAARALLQSLKVSSSQALTELRSLVRGIHPPILADRGLTDAVRALALDAPVEVTVRSSLTGRAPLPLESAMYFAVSELLSNVVKHSAATRVDIEMTGADDQLRICVQDNGRGGVDPSRGSGLRGIERRLAAFDGSLRISEAAEQPTTVTIITPIIARPR